MTAKDKYYIRVKNTLVEVTHEVYLVFYRFGRQERNQQEKEERNHVISYDAWDTGERTGQELLPLPDEANVEELAIAAIMSEQLHRCLRLLPEAERKLIYEIYFRGKSERELSLTSGLSPTAIHKRKEKVLRKLKNLMEN